MTPDAVLWGFRWQGWEIAESGGDPKSVPNHQDLVGAALELAQRVGAKSTTVMEARQENAFRSKGLLPQFTAANQKIVSSAQQVRRADWSGLQGCAC